MPVSRDALSGPAYLALLVQHYVRVSETIRRSISCSNCSMQVSGGAVSSALLKLDPVWDPLRNDPCFQKLITDGDAASGSRP